MFKKSRGHKLNSIIITAQHNWGWLGYDKILILGEMDFSYSLDIASNIGGKNIIATAYYNEQKAKKQTVENIQMFKKLNGKGIIFGVDATSLVLDESLRFDKILFGFPRNSESPNSQKHNVEFMRRVFQQVEKYLDKDGQFQCLLHINKSGRSPLEQWNMTYPKWQCVHEQIFKQSEVTAMFPLYQSHDGQNNKWMPWRTGVYVFKLRKDEPEKKIKSNQGRKLAKRNSAAFKRRAGGRGRKRQRTGG